MVSAGHGFLTREWADGTYTFRLAWGCWKEINEKCGIGPAELLDRLLNRKWRADDLAEVIRLGLIGGGMAPVDALRMVRSYVHERPLLESVSISLEIVSASLFGPADGEKRAGEAVVAKVPGTGDSPLPLSTETVQ